MKPKNIKYYEGEEATLQEAKLRNKIEKLNLKHDKLNEKLTKQMEKRREDNVRDYKRVIKTSGKISKLEIKIQRNERNIDLLKEGKLVKHNLYRRFTNFFSNMEYSKQTMIWGMIFVIPWVIGMLLFFIPSFTETILWSFSDVTLTPNGAGLAFTGLDNFKELFGNYVIDNTRIFTVELLLFMKDLIIDLPIIIIFSILIAVLLNKKFKGHTVVKAIFFIPVIYNLAVITDTLTGSFGQHFSSSMGDDVTFVNQITSFFMEIGIGESLLEIVLSSVERIFTIVNLSGIQILIFVAAIQAIPNHLYEAAQIEGATKYETFWKITIPMIMPMILTAAVYTVVDSFTRAPIFRFLDYAMTDGKHGLAASISVSYFVINLLILGLIFLIFKGRVFYYDDEN